MVSHSCSLQSRYMDKFGYAKEAIMQIDTFAVSKDERNIGEDTG